MEKHIITTNNADSERYFRVKYQGTIIHGRYNTRDEAVKRCESYAHSLIPPVVSVSMLKDTTVVFTIELVENKKVISTEIYSAIIVMKR